MIKLENVYFRYKNDGNIYRIRIALGTKGVNGENTQQGYTIPENGIYKLKFIPSMLNTGLLLPVLFECFSHSIQLFQIFKSTLLPSL